VGPFESKQATDNTDNTEPNPCAVVSGTARVIRGKRTHHRDSAGWSECPQPMVQVAAADEVSTRVVRGINQPRVAVRAACRWASPASIRSTSPRA
jgi:hypothetical protein